MWQLMPKPGYVANPFAGGSHHNRGAAVDLTLVDANGHELEMPTGFDTFTERAHQFSKEPTPTQRANRLLLRMVMEKVGLVPIRTEWWHFQLPDAKKYPIIPSMTQ
jgi:D-alanyl-D-alanine dipeptidase